MCDTQYDYAPIAAKPWVLAFHVGWTGQVVAIHETLALEALIPEQFSQSSCYHWLSASAEADRLKAISHVLETTSGQVLPGKLATRLARLMTWYAFCAAEMPQAWSRPDQHQSPGFPRRDGIRFLPGAFYPDLFSESRGRRTDGITHAQFLLAEIVDDMGELLGHHRLVRRGVDLCGFANGICTSDLSGDLPPVLDEVVGSNLLSQEQANKVLELVPEGCTERLVDDGFLHRETWARVRDRLREAHDHVFRHAGFSAIPPLDWISSQGKEDREAIESPPVRPLTIRRTLTQRRHILVSALIAHHFVPGGHQLAPLKQSELAHILGSGWDQTRVSKEFSAVLSPGAWQKYQRAFMKLMDQGYVNRADGADFDEERFMLDLLADRHTPDED